MAIYINGKPSEDWKSILATQIGKGAKLKRDVKFFLCESYWGERVVDDKPIKTCTPEFALPAVYSTVINGAAVEVRYVEKPSAKARKGGEAELKYLPENIIFIKGSVTVKKNQEDLFYFLSNHPRCESNPEYYTLGKDGKLKHDDAKLAIAMSSFKSFIFKERNEAIEQENKYDLQEGVIKAKHYIVTKMTKPEVIEIYKIYETDWDEDMPLPRMKNYLLAKAEEDPKKFMEQLDGEVRTFKAKVNEARAAEVIWFDAPKKVWRWSGADNGSNNQILTVAKGKDPVEALVIFLRDKDNGELLKAIEEAVKEREAATIE